MFLHPRLRPITIALCLALGGVCLAGAEQPRATASAVITTSAVVETEPAPNSGDAADDVAIWVNPASPGQSIIIGTDKKGGLAVYDLAGRQLQYLADGTPNNVDIRPGFPLGGQQVALVAASRDNDHTVGVYRVNPATRLLENVAARPIATGDAYGACMYHSARSGKFYYFVTGKSGVVEQWELFDNGGGSVDARQVRSFDVGTQVEGCVADDALGHLYVGEEDAGIWKYSAEPTGGVGRAQVDTTGAGGHLTADVEGLTIAYTGDGTGYLIASSQGDNSYVVYERAEGNRYLRTFQIVVGNGIDGTEDTDGIDVTTASLGPAFPAGVFIAQDGKNDDGNQNFKLIRWEQIIGAPGAGPLRTFLPLAGG
jgi:3-phytase